MLWLTKTNPKLQKTKQNKKSTQNKTNKTKLWWLWSSWNILPLEQGKPTSPWALWVQPVGAGNHPSPSLVAPLMGYIWNAVPVLASPVQVRCGCAGMKLMEVTSGHGARALNLQEEAEQVMVVQPKKENPRGKSYCCLWLPDQRISRS